MPVLTCPFTAIPKQTLKAASLSYPSLQQIVSELSIKPVAQETWSIEGISLRFTTEYFSNFYVNITAARKSLEKEKGSLEERREMLKTAEISAENVLTNRLKIYEEGPTTEKATFVEEARIALATIRNEIKGVGIEIQKVERELGELGHQTALEGLKEGLRASASPLTILASAYARGNELVWTTELAPLRFFSLEGFAFIAFEGGVVVTKAVGEWREALSDHIQFQDPLDITERENLRLVIEFYGPPAPVSGGTKLVREEGGPEVLNVTLSQVQAVVNYSRQVTT